MAQYKYTSAHPKTQQTESPVTLPHLLEGRGPGFGLSVQRREESRLPNAPGWGLQASPFETQNWWDAPAEPVAAEPAVTKPMAGPTILQRLAEKPVPEGQDQEEQDLGPEFDWQRQQIEAPIRRRAEVGAAGGDVSGDLEQRIQRSRGQGQEIAAPVRGRLEQAFGRDFGGVRIHANTEADQLNRAVQAKAFTTGNDIYFKEGEYRPESRGGQELLAHELTHVVQQTGLIESANFTHSSAQDIASKVQRQDTYSARISKSSQASEIGAGEVKKEIQIKGPSDWTQEDRENNSQRWQEACLYNLKNNNSAIYIRIEQRRDFYRWFYEYHATKGWTTRWALAASIVANGAQQVAYPFTGEELAQLFGSISNELQGFMRIGNQVIFDNVFPKLKQLHEGGPLQGKAAMEWDMKILSEEQQLIQPLYEGVSKDTRDKLESIAKVQGLAWLGSHLTEEDSVEKGDYNNAGDVSAFPEEDSITSVDDRWRYGMNLGNKFTPGGTGYSEKEHSRPEPGEDYTNGNALATVSRRHNLHMLDAELDLLGRANISTVRNLLRKLTLTEKRELALDHSPDGFKYSDKLSMIKRLKREDVEAALPPNGKSRKNFLENFDKYRPDSKNHKYPQSYNPFF